MGPVFVLFCIPYFIPLLGYTISIAETANCTKPIPWSRNIFWMCLLRPIAISVFVLYWTVRILPYTFYLRGKV